MTEPPGEVFPAVLPAARPAEPARFCDVPWQPRDVICAGGFLLFLLLGAWLARNWGLTLEYRRAFLLAVVAAYLALGIFPVWLARRRLSGFTLRLPTLSQWRSEISWSILLLFGQWAVLIVVLGLWSLVSSEPPGRGPEEIAGSGPSPVVFIFLAAAVLAAPFIEEVFFRGVLYNALRRGLPFWLAALVQAVLFGLLHSSNVGYMLATFVIGLYLALVYEWRKTLLTPILIHGLHNGTVATITLALLVINAYAPVLGISGDKEPQGVRITHVHPGTAAEQAGLQPGDVLVSIDDQAVADLDDVRLIMRQSQVGKRVRLVVLRDGQWVEVEATLRGR